jgi:hypothetical protein
MVSVDVTARADEFSRHPASLSDVSPAVADTAAGLDDERQSYAGAGSDRPRHHEPLKRRAILTSRNRWR